MTEGEQEVWGKVAMIAIKEMLRNGHDPRTAASLAAAAADEFIVRARIRALPDVS
jgi:hypothetical protein